MCAQHARSARGAVAVAGACFDVAAPTGVVAMGEIGLAGELRRVRDLPQRLSEAARLGFKVAIIPPGAGELPASVHRLEAGNLMAALRALTG